MYAIIVTGGRQYRVAQGEVLRVEKIAADVGAEVKLDQVLLVGEGEGVTVGAPLVAGALVKLREGRSSRISAFSSTKRMDWSSSTIQIGFNVTSVIQTSSGQRNQDLEIRPPRHALAFDQPMMLLHECLRQREPQPFKQRVSGLKPRVRFDRTAVQVPNVNPKHSPLT